MKKIINTSLALFMSILIYGQDTNKNSNTNKIKFRSIEVGLGSYFAKYKKNRFISEDLYVTEELEDDVGVSLNVNTSFLIRKNILSLCLNIGNEFDIWGGGNNFGAVSLMYGREWGIMKWFAIESHVGMGMYSSGDREFDGRNVNLVRKQVLGVPLEFKFMFYKKVFGMGLNTGVNFNSINTTYYGNFTFRYMFN